MQETSKEKALSAAFETIRETISYIKANAAKLSEEVREQTIDLINQTPHQLMACDLLLSVTLKMVERDFSSAQTPSAESQPHTH